MLEQRINDGAWEGLGSQRVVLGEDGVLKRTSFRLTPRVVGQYEFRARVEDAGPELTLDDNMATAAVRVVRQQIRVLLIAGAASPEVQFLRNALMRDQHVEFAGWIQHADPGFRQPGDRPITRLPNSDTELRQYDALLLVDPDLRILGAQWPEMITHFVGQEGGGLIFVAGELYSQQLFEAAEPKAVGGDWTRILPVVRDAGLYRSEAEVRLSSQNTYTLELTPEGRGDPVFEFHADPIRNRAILTSLPGMYWSFPVTRCPPRRDRPGPPRRPADDEPVRPARAPGLAALRSRPHDVHRLRQHLTAGGISPKITSTASGLAWSIAWDGTRHLAAGSRSRSISIKASIASATGYRSASAIPIWPQSPKPPS